MCICRDCKWMKPVGLIFADWCCHSPEVNRAYDALGADPFDIYKLHGARNVTLCRGIEERLGKGGKPCPCHESKKTRKGDDND